MVNKTGLPAGTPGMGKKPFTLLWKLSLTAVVAILLSGAVYHKELTRLYHVVTLFEPDKIAGNFRNMEALFDTRRIQKGETSRPFKRDPGPLPRSFTYKGETLDTARFLKETRTTGLMVIKDDKVRHEQYFLGNTENDKNISWSMGKSIVSALVGIAVHEGAIDDLDKPVSDYVPLLRQSGYNGVSLRNVLQMSSGIGFNEDYGDFHSDINRMSRTFALSMPLDDFVVSLKAERDQGIFNHYVSMDTQVLGMVLRETTGKNLSVYLEEKIWKKAGMESDALWIIDSQGMEAAFGGLNVVLRDYARFGLLFLHNGRCGERQVIPAQWIKDSVTPDAPHLMPGKRNNSSWVMGYGYQWWLPENTDGDYMAIGIYNQYIYIDPKRGTIVVKLSAYPDYNDDGEEKTFRSVALFRKIARTM
ncbi:MAG: beta-lactamase family protein [Desulfobacterales bacterium]|nr:beta-lactamase family protein [Desulfobacterales bacterium]